MRHQWQICESTDTTRSYKCEKCGAGPVQTNILSGKPGILRSVKKAGISPDCKVEVCKRVMEE